MVFLIIQIVSSVRADALCRNLFSISFDVLSGVLSRKLGLGQNTFNMEIA